MKQKDVYIVAGIGAALLIIGYMARRSWQTITDWLIPEFEGFRATPYWDVSRYSWGYGTQAPSGTGTITKAQALVDMRKVLESSYEYLKPMITRPLSGNQWAALLSFAYNLGNGNADNLVANINSGNDDALENQWKLYVNSGGSVNSDLVDRRNTEWNVWTGNIS